MKLYRFDEFDWITPDWLFEWLDWHYRFELDAAASKQNAKCSKYITQDALRKEWNANSIFLHIPSVRNIADWVRKAYRESQQGKVVACVLPVRTDTGWFHDYCTMASEILFLRGRMEATVDDIVVGKAGFPHMVVIFDGRDDKIFNGLKVSFVNCGTLRDRHENRNSLLIDGVDYRKHFS